MPVTFDQCRRAMHAALRREPGPHRSAADLVNGFGRWWTSAHPWEYLEGRTAEIEVSSAARVYALPADLARLDSIQSDATVSPPVCLVSGWRHFEQLRRGISVTYAGQDGLTSTLAAIVRHGAAAGPELELTHAPAAATWTLRYRAGWSPVSSEGQGSLTLPWYAEQAFLEGLVVYTLASERAPADGSESLVSLRLAQFFEGPLMQAAISQDGELSGDTYIGEGEIGMRLHDESDWMNIRTY